MALSLKPGKGADKFYYAILTESTDTVGGTPTWGTPVAISNLIECSFDSASASGSLYADNGPAFVDEVIGDMSVTLTLADVLPADYAALIGATYANGMVNQDTSDTSPYIAIGYRKLHSGKDGSDLVYTYVWIYKVKLQKPQIVAQTANASVNFQTVQLSGKVVKLNANGDYLIKARSDDPNFSSTTETNWFNAPVLATSDTTALTATIAEGTVGDAGKIVFTFAKGSGASFSLVSDTCIQANLPVATASGLVAGTYAVGSAGTTVTVKFTPTVAFSGSDVVSAWVSSGVKDNSAVSATAVADIITIA